MSTKQVIIIGFFNDSKSVRRLSRETGLNRRTVQKYIDEHHSLLLQQGTQAAIAVLESPTYRRSDYSKSKLTSEVCNFLDTLLEKNDDHRKSGRSKQCLKMIDMHESLLQAGHQVSYTSVRRFVNQGQNRGSEAFIKQVYAAGQSVEFDWGEVKINLNGRAVTLQLAVFTSAYSGHRWAMLFHRQDMSSFLESHVRYFESVGGVAGEFVYDNMRTAVAKLACRNKDKVATDDLLRLSTYYGFGIRFCNVRSGNEKGHVERSVEYVRRKAFSIELDFDDLPAANTHLFETCNRLNDKPMRGEKNSISARFTEEQLLMKPAQTQAYDYGLLRLQKVDKLGCVMVDRNHYSVSDCMVGQMVEVRVYANRIDFFNPKTNKLVAEHVRQYVVNEYFMKIEHFLHTLRQKPGALLGSVAWKQAETLLHQIHTHFFKDRVKDFIELISWSSTNDFDIKSLPDALKRAHDARPHLPVDIDAVKLILTARHTPPNPTLEKKSSAEGDTIRQYCKQQLAEAQLLFSP